MARSHFTPQRGSLLSRRCLLRFGALGLTAGAAPGTAAAPLQARGFGRARSLLFVSLYGGPSHLDMWDMKPEAPAEVRGEFRPVRNSVPGMEVCEHLPHLGRLARRFALIRSVTHQDNGHRSAAYASLTGWPHRLPNTDPLPDVTDHPGYGAVLAAARPRRPLLPAWVALGSDFIVEQLPGEHGGFLGRAREPFAVREDPSQPAFQVPDLALPPGGALPRLERRRTLREKLGTREEKAGIPSALAQLQEEALALLAAPRLRDAFALDREAPRVRDRYGRTPAGQSLLLARRLVEAEVPCVTVNWHRDGGIWDTHSDNFKTLRQTLLPELDTGLGALLEDLQDRGLLEQTLVVVAGEFGRTPHINQAAGRDHWPFVYTVLLAGGGVQGGLVHGASDRSGAYPAEKPVGPGDVAATLFHCLGISPETTVSDLQGRPVPVYPGDPVLELLGSG